MIKIMINIFKYCYNIPFYFKNSTDKRDYRNITNDIRKLKYVDDLLPMPIADEIIYNMSVY